MVKEKHVNLAVAAVLLCLDAVYLYTAFHGRQYKGSVVGPLSLQSTWASPWPACAGR